MIDGMLLGALLITLGALVGGMVIWLIERWHDDERELLARHIGHLQGQLEQQRSIPEEEL